MTILLPVSLAADDAAAILQSNGGVLVNKNSVRPAWTLFPGDLIETQPGFSARIQLDGSTVDIGPETIIEFERGEAVLDHGSVFVDSSREFRVRSGCVVVIPAIAEWTQYDVSNTNGKVTVLARKRDVNVTSQAKNVTRLSQSESSRRVTVREGEQQSRDEKCGAADAKSSPGASVAVMNSPYAVSTGFALVGTGAFCILVCFNDDPLSRSCPTGSAEHSTANFGIGVRLLPVE